MSDPVDGIPLPPVCILLVQQTAQLVFYDPSGIPFRVKKGSELFYCVQVVDDFVAVINENLET